MDRPVTTLFMLMSVDGKISTGSTANLDFDKDLPSIHYVNNGLYQYYYIERTTDLWSLCTGKTRAKIGINTSPTPDKTDVSFVLVDNTNLDENGVRNMCALSDKFVLITTNSKHPAFYANSDNLFIIYQECLSLSYALVELKSRFGCDAITIQSGGTLNSIFLREQLIDYVDIVVAPIIVGGKDTPTLVDGVSFTTTEELSKLSTMQLIESRVLSNSYIRLKYRVI